MKRKEAEKLYVVHNFSIAEISRKLGLSRHILYGWKKERDWDMRRLVTAKEMVEEKIKRVVSDDEEFRRVIARDSREVIAMGMELLKARIGSEKKPSLLVKCIEGVVKIRLMVDSDATEVVKELDIKLEKDREGKIRIV